MGAGRMMGSGKRRRKRERRKVTQVEAQEHCLAG